MFKWPKQLPARPTESEQGDYNELLAWKLDLADFSELISWQSGRASDRQVANQLSKLEENDHAHGVPATDDLHEWVTEAFGLVEDRTEMYGSGYPFELDTTGRSLRWRPSGSDARQIVYRYLLLATRLDMNINKKSGGMDGTDLFEQLCAEVAGQYFGAGSRNLVFGTSSDIMSFPERVNTLCRQIGEGNSYKNNSGGNPQAKDDGLDVVVWNPFFDDRTGKLIGFGQCKTGTHYEEHFTRLHPNTFCQNWFEVMPAVWPVRMFFITDALPEDRWYKRTSNAGILFDRPRIIELSGNVSPTTLADLATWTQAAASANGLPIV